MEEKALMPVPIYTKPLSSVKDSAYGTSNSVIPSGILGELIESEENWNLFEDEKKSTPNLSFVSALQNALGYKIIGYKPLYYPKYNMKYLLQYIENHPNILLCIKYTSNEEENVVFAYSQTPFSEKNNRPILESTKHAFIGSTFKHNVFLPAKSAVNKRIINEFETTGFIYFGNSDMRINILDSDNMFDLYVNFGTTNSIYSQYALSNLLPETKRTKKLQCESISLEIYELTLQSTQKIEELSTWTLLPNTLLGDLIYDEKVWSSSQNQEIAEKKLTFKPLVEHVLGKKLIKLKQLYQWPMPADVQMNVKPQDAVAGISNILACVKYKIGGGGQEYIFFAFSEAAYPHKGVAKVTKDGLKSFIGTNAMHHILLAKTDPETILNKWNAFNLIFGDDDIQIVEGYNVHQPFSLKSSQKPKSYVYPSDQKNLFGNMVSGTIVEYEIYELTFAKMDEGQE